MLLTLTPPRVVSLRDGSSYWAAAGVERAVGAHACVVAGAFDDAGDGGGGDLPGIPGIALLSPSPAAGRNASVASPAASRVAVTVASRRWRGCGPSRRRSAAARDVEDEAHVARAVGGHAGARLPGGIDGVRARR